MDENKTWDQKRLEEIISNEAEESVYLDFKAAEALVSTEGKKKEICKDVSSFANSDGGVIIYGINEVNHKADSFSFINGNSITKEWLEQIINDGIQRRIDGIRIHPIRVDNDINKTVYVVEIPVSPLAPHMTKDNRYYKRYNFMSVPMEEYEVRHTYERKENSKLEIGDVSFEVMNGKTWFKDNRFSFLITFHIKNIGYVVADHYKLRCVLKGAEGCSYSHGTNKDYNIIKLPDEGISFSSTIALPIYPDEEINIMELMFNIPFGREKTVVENLQLDLTLFMQHSRIDENFKPGNTIRKQIDFTIGENNEAED